jgi:hypothetical protein
MKPAAHLTAFDEIDLMETNVYEPRNHATHSLRAGRILVGVTLFLLLSLVYGTAAQASFEFDEAGVDLTGPDGRFSRQAGGHPDLTVNFSIPFDPNAHIDGRLSPGPVEAVHEVDLDLPRGFVGNPQAAERCPTELLSPAGLGSSLCPVSAQVGVVEVIQRGVNEAVPYRAPVYNMQTGPGAPARFGFEIAEATTVIDAHVRPGAEGYGISAGSSVISQAVPIEKVAMTLWGVPADSSHDAMRGTDALLLGGEPLPAQSPRLAFLSAPTSCPDTPTPFTIRGDSWDYRGIFDTRILPADESGTPFVFEGCEQLPFAPSIDVQPRSHLADSPTGLKVELRVPQNDDPDGLAAADVKQVVMTFPEGMSINPASASGQSACSPAQIDLETNAAPSCPETSKLGTVKIDTPLLPDELEGSAYLATQNDNPFGSLLAMYIAVKGPGFYLKLPGRIDADPKTGELTTTFSDTPQLPFERLQLSLNEGPRAPLSTPHTCGTYTTHTEFTSWAQPDNPVVSESSFMIDEGCDKASKFDPDLSAGTISPAGGSYSPFILRVTRRDGEENISRIQATLPEGLLAKLAGVARCSDAAAATGDCPASSQIGTTTVGTGSGPNPLYVPEAGKAPPAIYLAGAYKGAPYSLVVKVPAQAGPFDLGTVVVRNALYIDPVSAQVTAKSDPLPQLLQGIPLSYRDVRVEINRDQFTINPTNCEAMKVTSTLTSAAGASAHPSDRFQAANCAALGFKPNLKISLKGKMNRTGNPTLTATLRAPKGQANIAKTTVVLPQSQFIDNSHISNPCTRVQFDARDCPAGSILGKATAYSPLLDKPLSGPVYFRSNGGARELPDLVADLNGQIHVTLVGFIDSVKTGPETSRVRTRFLNVPDAPVSKFTIRLAGGKKGLIENSRDLCSFTPKAKLEMTGQNGKTAHSNLKLGTSCGKASKRGK